jgi:hypothetical protein
MRRSVFGYFPEIPCQGEDLPSCLVKTVCSFHGVRNVLKTPVFARLLSGSPRLHAVANLHLETDILRPN